MYEGRKEMNKAVEGGYLLTEGAYECYENRDMTDM
jgi:hypothetical protein